MRQVVYEEVLTNHLTQIIENDTSGWHACNHEALELTSVSCSCESMMRDAKWDDLGRMYKMLNHIKVPDAQSWCASMYDGLTPALQAVGHPKLREALKSYVDAEGTAFVQVPEPCLPRSSSALT